MKEEYLLDIALILLSTKALGLITKKFNLPQVVGALLAGLILGPTFLNIISEHDFISKVAELGVIVLMFNAGLQSNVDELKKAGKDLFIIALMGVIIPLAGCFILACFFNNDLSTKKTVMENIFIGAVFTATSVSITVETLKEIGKLQESSANAILGAAVVDDVLGIIVLTIISSMADTDVSILKVILQLIAFAVFALVVAIISFKLFGKWVNYYHQDKRRFVIAGFVLCLLISYCADTFFGVADITGAYIAGLILSRNFETKYLTRRFETLSYILLSPIFFANIGLNADIKAIDIKAVIFSVLLIIMAVATKIIGCFIGAKICSYSLRDSMKIGVGMIPRGEVALVIASKGLKLGFISSYYLTPIIITVIFSAICAPIILKNVYSYPKSNKSVNNMN